MIKIRQVLLMTLIVALYSGFTSATTLNEQEKLFSRFSALALSCVNQEYPNSVKHVFISDNDVKSPKQLYPAFYGCLDWHSSVHGHWLLVRLLNQNKTLANRSRIIEMLSASFTAEKIAGELAYFNRPNTGTSFERPYGLAWFLQLTAEIRQYRGPQATKWLAALKPLESKIVENITIWLPKLAYPIRVGEHSQTAFAFGLMLDWAKQVNNQAFTALLTQRIKHYYLKDEHCPLSYEPSGQDFLSPCIAEADLIRRILTADDYALWLTRFLPNIPKNGNGEWLSPATVTDKSDGKLAHLDGLNLSRAWMLEGIAHGLPINDVRRTAILASAKAHENSGINSVLHDMHYMGSHWLGSFATYLETQRGLQ